MASVVSDMSPVGVFRISIEIKKAMMNIWWAPALYPRPSASWPSCVISGDMPRWAIYARRAGRDAPANPLIQLHLFIYSYFSYIF